MSKRRVHDSENPPLTAEDFAQMRPALEVMPLAVAAAYRRSRGPQKTPTKRPISLRVDPDVLAAYRATGKGWQARMNDTLAAHAPRHRATASRTSTAKRRIRRASSATAPTLTARPEINRPAPPIVPPHRPSAAVAMDDDDTATLL